MPIYDISCPVCGDLEDVWAKVEQIRVECPRCGTPTKRLMSPTRIQCDIETYFDENMGNKENPQGQWVKSRQHKRELLKKEGLMEIG